LPIVFTPEEAEEKPSEEDLAHEDKWRPSILTDRFIGEL